MTLVEGVAMVYKPPTRDYRVRKSINGFLTKRSIDRRNFFQKVSYLKRHGVIREYCEGKERFIEITAKGINKLKIDFVAKISIVRPKLWDKKWRVVMFDIPEKDRQLRNIIRDKLYRIGFEQVQKSIFIFPFECSFAIEIICDQYGGRQYLKYLIADILEGEDAVIEQFIDKGTLTMSDLE